MSDRNDIFEQLYRTNGADLLSYIRRSVADLSTAQDLVQDSFVNFFRAFRSGPIPDALGSRKYLFRIARNLVINSARAAYSRRVDLRPGVEDVAGRGAPEDQVIDRMTGEDNEKKLADLLVGLPEDERTAVLLRYDQSMKLEEIASVMKISVSTASRLVHRAAHKLVQAGKSKGYHFSLPG